jgi:tellurite resistance protein
MDEQDKAIVKSLVSFAWADGKVTFEEKEVLEAFLQAFNATREDAAEIREYAKQTRSLDDIPLTDLSADNRRLLLQHAVLITFIDGEQAPEEKKLLEQLCAKLRIPADEAAGLFAVAEDRAKRLVGLLPD